ncbi:ABC transporter ATP-binding protein [Lentilactobacillus hilgardii]|uniref:ABC transporter ATP-binding protein n=1 Tax=Lentilactobacillus hilgardii TaxID=1588 RepID=UPI0021A4125E|nr:ABC transporter ATP-binding protein [Lentilactobacillus hilgardii]MCT3398845.1 ABC transporter ATP-binding protein [Lentilactobacillus hilgardii]
MSIELKNVTKKIRKTIVLKNISYHFEAGQICGLAGRNGSGKTMLIRAIAGLLIPSSGQVIIDGEPLHKKIDFPPSVGVTIENTVFPRDLTGLENLVTLGKIKHQATLDDIKSAFEKVGMSEREWNTKVSKYSLGMRQKLSIAQALFEKPKLLLLDEPTNGLDQESTEKLRKTLRQEADHGTTVILASHDKDDLKLLSQTVVHIDGGSIVDQN